MPYAYNLVQKNISKKVLTFYVKGYILLKVKESQSQIMMKNVEKGRML